MARPQPKTVQQTVEQDQEFRPTRIIVEDHGPYKIIADSAGYKILRISDAFTVHMDIGNKAWNYDHTKIVREFTQCCPTTNLQRAKLFLETYQPAKEEHEPA